MPEAAEQIGEPCRAWMPETGAVRRGRVRRSRRATCLAMQPAGRPVRVRSLPGAVTLPMPPEQFIAKWKLSTLGERDEAAQPHFLDLCELLGEPKPEDPDNYCFERGALKSSGRRGWADVWKRGHFAWEYKGKGANLESALAQLQQYALALENPPLLVVCDLERFLIVTNWTNTVSRRISLRLEDLADPAKREILKQLLSDPDRLKPGLTREQITAERALSLAGLARDLRARGHHPERVAKFLVRLVFCMFAQGIGLLPRQMLTRMLEAAEHNPGESEALAEQLFRTMATGGWLGFERVRLNSTAACSTLASKGRWRYRWTGPRSSRPSRRWNASGRRSTLHPGHAVRPEPRPQADGGSVPQRRHAGFRGGDLPALV